MLSVFLYIGNAETCIGMVSAIKTDSRTRMIKLD